MPRIAAARTGAMAGLACLALLTPEPAGAALHDTIAQGAAAAAPRVIAMRQDFHQHPELSNRETRTARIIAERLRALNLTSVRTGVARTGVVAVLKGRRPGPVVALRADIDALPITEATGLTYASVATAEYEGRAVGVMHACGHDAHIAILLGAAEVLAGMRDQLQGTVIFIFQPAEEGPPDGEPGGARLMLEEDAYVGLKPQAIFGLHVRPGQAGRIYARSGGMMAASDIIDITVSGRQTHAAFPWRGVDPVPVAAEIVTTLQTMVGRELDIVKSPVVVSFGSLHGGVRGNVIPDAVRLVGTLRTLDPEVRTAALAAIRRRVEHTAAAAGATAQITFSEPTPPVINPPDLMAQALTTLRWAAGANGLDAATPTMASDDFAVFQAVTPGVYFNLGVTPPGVPPAEAAPNHSAQFLVADDALVVGVRALSALAADYLAAAADGADSTPR